MSALQDVSSSRIQNQTFYISSPLWGAGFESIMRRVRLLSPAPPVHAHRHWYFLKWARPAGPSGKMEDRTGQWVTRGNVAGLSVTSRLQPRCPS